MSIDIELQLRRGDFSLDLSFCAPGSGITAVFGPSGCGKTTLLRAIAGLEPDAIGRVSVNDDIWQAPGTWVPTHRRAVGYVFQEASLFPHLTVRGNLDYALKRRRAAALSFEQVVSLLGVEPLLQRNTHKLSGGERQRVAIGRALLSSPQLLLMDEPLAALDSASKAEILPYLERLHESLALPIIYVSHAAAEVARLADHLLLLKDGRLAAEGPLAKVLGDMDTPLARTDEAFCIVGGEVESTQQALTTLRLGDQTLRLPPLDVQPKQRVRLRVYARDISLCLDRPTRSSILNILPAQVLDIDSGDGRGQCLVRLAVADAVLLARISEHSRRQLDLKTGDAVYAQIKAMALAR
ncbi:molybdenum ABC transporter ATP-binding protein [Exilibacterium tricleocarpae]|uniref:Molybdenum ABC transporter ATP-binding protein n=1 Tax=Exilibacterium tricleocarpae TaxID=2591008 RepID=A0A545UBE2_9GAMM|nr:molybdenum ABC transporter ATP-binding protein [Exilibacterium tricleocarpae]TQV86777.1 molybdenum ABC transporter ATP-binding protein [Exilibacterium tricleocarpae]